MRMAPRIIPYVPEKFPEKKISTYFFEFFWFFFQGVPSGLFGGVFHSRKLWTRELAGTLGGATGVWMWSLFPCGVHWGWKKIVLTILPPWNVRTSERAIGKFSKNKIKKRITLIIDPSLKNRVRDFYISSRFIHIKAAWHYSNIQVTKYM